MKRFATRQTPVVLVTGIDEFATSAATIALQWDLPGAVSVRHTIDAEKAELVRTVSDSTGRIDYEVIDLAHSCVSCAIREDIVPTLERLAADGRWNSIVAHLPLSAEASQICRVAAWDDRMPHVRISAVVTALNAQTLEADLLGSDVLADRDLATGVDDARGVGEVTCAMVEYADVVCLDGEQPTAAGLAVLRQLMRPGNSDTAAVLAGAPDELDTVALHAGVHVHERTETWADDVRRQEFAALSSPHAWTVDLHSDRPFHPGRLLEAISSIGGGATRSRGCFWLPTRPLDVGVWSGAGGELSIGLEGRWGPAGQVTRITVTGTDGSAEAVRQAFEGALLTDSEFSENWAAHGTDGLEQWLGPISRAA